MWQLVAALAAGLAVAAWRSPGAGRLHPLAEEGRARARFAAGPSRTRLLSALAIGACGLVLCLGLGWPGVAAAAALGVASQFVLGRLSSAAGERRRAELVAGLPQACDLIRVCLAAGLPLRAAVEVLAGVLPGTLGGLLAELATKVRLGADEAAAWSELGGVEPALAELGRELGRTVRSGESPNLTLAALAATARADALAAAEVAARRVGVRSVLPLMVCFLPSFLLLGVVPVVGGVAQHLFR